MKPRKNNRTPENLATLRTAAIFGNLIYFIKYSREENRAFPLRTPICASSASAGECGAHINSVPSKSAPQRAEPSNHDFFF